jgi:uroporphyrinogen decarboxylase
MKALACEAVDRAPVWLMRQAGRVLPEYRALKEKYSFVELVQTPELAAEVTLQPIRRFGFDGAILFSDILVVAEGLGQSYHFRDNGGIRMEFTIRSAEDIERLEVEPVVERLQYVAQALSIIKSELGGKTALLGFAGAPWTLANFMMEGGSAKEFTRAKALFYSDPALLERLCEKLTEAVASFLRLQIASGVDAVQIFDSLGGLLAPEAYYRASGQWIERIISELDFEVPVILFAKGVHGDWDALVSACPSALSIDWTLSLRSVADLLPRGIAVQGNLDPCLLIGTPEAVAAETDAILQSMRDRPGHVFNLGHGVPPNARLECVESLVETVRNFK